MPKKSKEERVREASKKYAKRRVAEAFQDTKLDDDNLSAMPRFSTSELTLGKILGQGGYATAREIRAFQVPETKGKKVKQASEEERAQVSRQSRAFMALNCLRGEAGDARYAIKALSKSTVADSTKFLHGIIGLGSETRLLSSFSHPSIVKLRAVADVEFVDEGYFLVLDRLYDTLLERFDKWRSQLKKFKGLAGKLKDRKGKKATAFLEERLCTALDICFALDYLHRKNIVYRDVKPENCGFDVRGTIKIFDFGIARELHEENRLPDGTYKLTNMTGSMIYMAPEIALAKNYNLKCDVFSVAILMYEMLALVDAYPTSHTLEEFQDKVHVEGQRPSLDGMSLSRQVERILQKGWDADFLKTRPTMAEFAELVQDEIQRIRGGEGPTSILDRSACSLKSGFFVAAQHS